MSKQVINEIIKDSSRKDVLKKICYKNSKVKGITFGTKESLFYDGNTFFKGLVFITDAIDSTRAGNAFQSGIILGIIKNLDLQFTVDIASVMAGLEDRCTSLSF